MTDLQQCALAWLFVSTVYYVCSLDDEMPMWKRLGLSAIGAPLFLLFSIAFIGTALIEMTMEKWKERFNRG